MRTLYDASLLVYNYKGMSDSEMSFSFIYDIHIFFGNILLINFLVAILTSTYQKMQQTAIFKYKVNLFQYCQKYMIAFENESIAEFIIHAPPLCFLTTPMILFSGVSAAMKPISKGFSYFMFWGENFFFFIFFSLYEFILVPFVFGKIFYNILTCSYGLFTTIFYCFVWIICGLFFVLFIVFRDMYLLL